MSVYPANTSFPQIKKILFVRERNYNFTRNMKTQKIKLWKKLIY